MNQYVIKHGFENLEDKPTTQMSKNIVSYSRRKPRHTSKYFKLKKKINTFNLKPKLKEDLVETSEEESNPESSKEIFNEIQNDEQDLSCDNTSIVNILIKEQDLLFKTINFILNSTKKIIYLNKLKQNLRTNYEQ